MRELIGNIWHYHNQDPASYVVIPTNGYVKNNGANVMGRGLALEASRRFPPLPAMLGAHLQAHGNHVAEWPSVKLYTFPVKDVWYNKADINLIEQSCVELLDLLNFGTMRVNRKVYMPRVGCGNGGLDWALVQHTLFQYFKDDTRISIVSRKEDL